MPTSTTTRIDDLPEFERGYVDAMISHFRSLGDAQDLAGLGTKDLAATVVTMAVKDCRRFTDALAKIDPDALDEANAELEDYELGYYLLLERQETGIGFSDLSVEPELRDKLLEAAGHLKPFDLEIRDDGKIHVVAGEPATRPAV